MYKLVLLLLMLTSYTFSQKRSIELSSIFHQYYEKSMSAWQGKDSTVLNYDNLGNVIDEVHYEGDDSLVLSYRKTFIYSNKLVQRAYSYFWDSQKSIWDTIAKTDFTYTNKDSIQTIISYGLSNGVWVNNAKEQFQYNNSDNLAHHDLFIWDGVNNLWVVDNTNSWDFVYDQNARRTEKITNVWNQQKKQLIQNQKEIYSYNLNDELEIILRQVWDGQNAWHNTGKDSIVYQNGLKHENFIFYFDELKGGIWVKTAKESFSYNQNKDHFQTLIQYWSLKQSNYITDENARLVTSHYDNNNRLTFVEDQMYDTINKVFTDYDQTYFYYSNFQMAQLSQKSNVEQIQILPNPANDSFKIVSNSPLNRIQIADATGKIVKEINQLNLILQSYSIDISDLSEDVYFTTIETNEGVSIHKLLVKR